MVICNGRRKDHPLLLDGSFLVLFAITCLGWLIKCQCSTLDFSCTEKNPIKSQIILWRKKNTSRFTWWTDLWGREGYFESIFIIYSTKIDDNLIFGYFWCKNVNENEKNNWFMAFPLHTPIRPIFTSLRILAFRPNITNVIVI